MIIAGFSSWDRSIYEILNKIPPETPLPFSLELALFPNLKVLKAEDKWVLTKTPRSNAKIQPGCCQIKVFSFFRRPSTVWGIFSGLPEILRYDFQISWLNCKLGEKGPWEFLLHVDLSSLKSLRLYVKTTDSNNTRADEELVAKLRRLPSLEEFNLDQGFPGRSDFNWLNLATMTNVLKQLARAKSWPRLRRLDLRFLATTVADFQTFCCTARGYASNFSMVWRTSLWSSDMGGAGRKILPPTLDQNCNLSKGRRSKIRTFIGAVGEVVLWSRFGER